MVQMDTMSLHIHGTRNISELVYSKMTFWSRYIRKWHFEVGIFENVAGTMSKLTKHIFLHNTYIHANSGTHAQTHKHIHAYTHLCANVYMPPKCISACMSIHISMQIQISMRISMGICAHISLHMHAFAHVYTQVDAHIYTDALMPCISFTMVP